MATRALRASALLLAVLLAPVVLAEGASYSILRWSEAKWFDTWDYVTVGDPELGFALRPGIHSRWTDVDVFINRDGVRDSRTDARVEPKAPNEWLILSLGDSTTFGNRVRFEDTYSARLEALLTARQSRPVRVVNLGVSGHSSFQSLRMLERWLSLRPDIVIFADSFNNRAIAPPDSEQTLRDSDRARTWEIGDRLSYSLVLAAKLLREEGDLAPPLDGALPESRVSLKRYPRILRQVVERAADAGALPVFLATGDDPAIAPLARNGMRQVETGRWSVAERTFGELVRRRPTYFLGWHHLYRAVREKRGEEDAEGLLPFYEEAKAGRIYLTRFASFADPYIASMGRVAKLLGIEFVDMRLPFESQKVEFENICHFTEAGHALIAEELARALTPPDA